MNIKSKLISISARVSVIWQWSKWYARCFMDGLRKDHCANCGVTTPFLKSCAMHERCILSQNKHIIDTHTFEELCEIMKKDGKVYATEPRPLCYLCWNENNAVCYHCDLEVSIERATK